MGFLVWKATTLDQPSLSKCRRISAGESVQLVSLSSLTVEVLNLLTSKSDVVVVHQTVDGIDLATNVEVTGSSIQVLDGRVGLVVGTENLDGLLLLVRAVDVVDGDDGQVAVISEVTEGDTGTGLGLDLVNRLLRDIEADGHGEKVAINETVVVDNAAIESVSAAHLVLHFSVRTRCSPSRS